MSSTNDHRYLAIAAATQAMTANPPDTIADAFAELLAQATVHIPGAEDAAVTVVERQNQICTPASTGEWPRTLDTIAQKHLQSPTFTTAGGGEPQFVDDLHTEQRWPLFRADALAHTPIRSIASYPLFRTRTAVGALTLYSVTDSGLHKTARDLGVFFAAHASIIVDAVRRTEQFETALASRDTIGQAKGMIMERYNVDAQRAFALMRKLSQDSNTRVFDVARTLVDIEHPTRCETATPPAGQKV